MRAAVLTTFPAFTETFEGRVGWLYLDVKGLVTTGRGNLADPVSLALPLPWMRGGYAATQDEVLDAWHAVKGRQDLARAGGGAFAPLTDLRLSDEAIDQLTSRKAAEMEEVLLERFVGWDDLPANAQLGTLSLAWACGPAFQFPKFAAALRGQDFTTCATECVIDATGNPGVVRRNQANQALFLAAAKGGDPDVLSWPSELPTLPGRRSSSSALRAVKS